jgi:hypothetical protein
MDNPVHVSLRDPLQAAAGRHKQGARRQRAVGAFVYDGLSVPDRRSSISLAASLAIIPTLTPAVPAARLIAETTPSR